MNADEARFRYWRDPVFLATTALYFANRYLIKPHLPRGEYFFRGHWNDLLLVPAALPIFLLTYRCIGLRVHDNAPSWSEVLFHVVLWSFFFEIFGPDFLHHGTADVWDVLSYALGGLVAWALWNPAVALARFRAVIRS
jgi:hypothetical protein